MKQIAPEQKLILLIAPVRKGRPQQSVAEGKAFPLIIVVIYLYLEKLNEELYFKSNAIQYAGDWDGFAASMSSFDTWSGVITSGAGSLVTNSLSSINSFDGNKLALNGNTFNTGAISKYNSLVGGLASSALSYGLTGEATFNVLNIADIGINSILNKAIGNTGAEPVKASCGLLEVSVGNDGVKTRLGTGGIDISYGTVLAAYTGLKESARVTSWKYGGVEKSSTLNSINMLGYTQNEHNKKLSKDIWNEKLGVEYGDTGKDYGNYTVRDDKIRLSEKLLGGGKEGSAKLAAVMSHEGTHAYGNRYEGIAHMAAADTYSQINTIFNLTGDASFSNEMLKGIMNPESWKENTGNIDHWKFDSDGNGGFGWRWDDDFDFNVGNHKITAEQMKANIATLKILSDEKFMTGLGFDKSQMNLKQEAYFSSGTKSDGTLASEEMINSFVRSGNVKDYSNFLLKSEGFADASLAALNLSNGKLSQGELTAMNQGLYAAQESGLLLKNTYNKNSSNLNGDGAIDSPYLPLTGTVYDTCDQGIRFVTEDFYNALRPQDRENFPLMGFAKNDHLHTDLVSYDSGNVVTSVDGSVGLSYSSTWGLNGVNYSSESNLAFLSNHLDSSSIKQYISLFGMEGTSLHSTGKDSFVLSGIQAGTTYATMGNTGISAGNHVDFGIYQINKPYKLNMYSDTRLSFKDVYNSDLYYYKADNWAKKYSGLTSRFLLDSSNSTVLETYLKYYQNKYDTDMNYWKKVNGWY